MTPPPPAPAPRRPSLSQGDVDRLIVETAEHPIPVARNARDVQLYDFRRPHRVSTDRLRTLEAMYSRLVKSLEGWLMGRVRGVVGLELKSVEQISFGEYMLSLPANCNSFILDIKDTAGEQAVGEQAVIDIGRELAFFLVDRLFGGGSETTIFDRALTPIERLAVRVVAERLMGLVGEIWEDVVALDMSLVGFESIPEIIQAAAREAPVLVTNIGATFSGVESLISIALPLSVLEKFFAMGTSKSLTHVPRRDPVNRNVTEGALRATRVELAARLPEFKLSMRDIAALHTGSMLSTGIPVDSHINLFVGDQPRFTCAAGRVGRKLAVRLLEPLSAAPLPSSLDNS
jgi:flagellar motor switch protein FliM